MMEGDPNQIQSEISEAEKRRNRRREKILANAEGRMQRIIGADDSGLKLKAAQAATGNETQSSLEDHENMPRKRLNKEKSLPKVNTEIRGSTFVSEPNLSSSSSTHDKSFQPIATTSSTENGTSQSRPSVTLEDGTTVHPKIPAWVGRVFVCFLGVILSVFNGKYFMVTFFSWEVAFLGINGLPTAPPPGIFLALVALVGLREPHLQRLRFVTQLLNTLITDLSLFVIAALLPRVILKM